MDSRGSCTSPVRNLTADGGGGHGAACRGQRPDVPGLGRKVAVKTSGATPVALSYSCDMLARVKRTGKRSWTEIKYP